MNKMFFYVSNIIIISMYLKITINLKWNISII